MVLYEIILSLLGGNSCCLDYHFSYLAKICFFVLFTFLILVLPFTTRKNTGCALSFTPCFILTSCRFEYMDEAHRDWEKAMAPHSRTLAWKLPWTEEPGRPQSMGSRRVGHGWATSLSLFTFMHWRRKWQPTPVFLPGESQGQGSLVGCRLWGRTESDTTEATGAAAAAQRLWVLTLAILAWISPELKDCPSSATFV